MSGLIAVCALAAGSARAQSGPIVSYLGLATPGGALIQPDGSVFLSATGTGFVIVIEGRPGPSGRRVGLTTFNVDGGPPELQVQVSQDLGTVPGVNQICNLLFDGVPASGTGDFAPTQMVTDALNDLGCNFTAHTDPLDSCLNGGFASSSTTQFCSTPISSALKFSGGDTIVSARLSDVVGNVGPVSQIVVRVEAAPTPTPTPSVQEVTATPTSTATATSTRTSTAPATVTNTPTAPSCTGDCNDDRAVGINELITCVNIALGNTQVVTCQPCDGDGDGAVMIDELIAAVSRALGGCPI